MWGHLIDNLMAIVDGIPTPPVAPPATDLPSEEEPRPVVVKERKPDTIAAPAPNEPSPKVDLFLDEHCQMGADFKVHGESLYDAYRARDPGAKEKWFHAQLKMKGYVKRTVRLSPDATCMGYTGFRLVPAAPPPIDPLE